MDEFLEKNSNQNTLVIHHIQKTAGTSFIKFLEQSLEPHHVMCRLGNGAEENAIHARFQESPEDFEKVKIVFGHHAFQVDKYFNNPSHGAFFRHPVSRLISAYYFTRKVIADGQYDAEQLPNPVELKLTAFLDALLKFGYSQSGYSNGAGDPNPNFLSLSLHLYLNKTHEPPTDEQNLANLDRLSFVGIQEHYSLSLFLLGKTRGLPLPKADPLNVSGSKSHFSYIPRWFICELRNHMKQDFALYEKAKEVFDTKANEIIFENLINQKEWFNYNSI